MAKQKVTVSKDTAEELERIEKRIANIQKKMDRERKNLVDSGYIDDSDGFWEVFYTIYKKYRFDMFPWVIKRHKLKPYVGEEKTDIENTYDVRLNDLPEGEKMKELLKHFREIAKKGTEIDL